MSSKAKEFSMEDVLKVAGKELPGHGHKAITFFLYKEILKNRLLILETTDKENKAAAQYIENEINEMNIKIMELLNK